MKKLLVLGATPFQVPVVRKAQAKGYYVITMDNIPGNYAHRISDETALVSITDCKKVLDFAIRTKIDAIITGGSDVGVVSIGYVCDKMGLPGISLEQGLTLTHKNLFRKFQQKHSLRHPDFFVFTNFADFLDSTKELTGKFVIKPIDCSGSKGLTIINFEQTNPESRLRKIFENAYSLSRAKRIVLESFLPGREHGGDAFLINGEIVSLRVTNKYLTPAPYYVPVGHTIPSKLAEPVLKKISEALGNVLHLLDIKNGPINFDVMVDDNSNVTIIEMSPRFGGNCIPQIIEYGAGFDEIGTSVDLAIDGCVPMIQPPGLKDCIPTGSRILGAKISGILNAMTAREVILNRFYSNIHEIVYDVEVGACVNQFVQGNYRMGHVIATAPTLEEMEELLKRIEAEIGIDVMAT